MSIDNIDWARKVNKIKFRRMRRLVAILWIKLNFFSSPYSNSFSRPYGVCSSKDAFSEKLNLNNPRDYKINSFFTLQKRHTYFQNSKPQSVSLNLNPKRQVRLRARRVVCHRCKNVCSESGRNAQFGGQQNDYR